MKHTPAPWVAHYAPDTGTTIWHDPRAHGDKRRGAVIVCSDVKNQGDVRLIEAAPDLLDALNLLLCDAESEHAGFNAHGMPITNPEHPWHESITRARAAIHKATTP